MARRVQKGVEPLEVAWTEVAHHQSFGLADCLVHALPDSLFGGAASIGSLGSLADQQREVEGLQFLGKLPGEVARVTVHADVARIRNPAD